MCKKVDNSVKIMGCCKAVGFLKGLAIFWLILGIIKIVIWCIVAFVIKEENAKNEDEGAAVMAVGFVVGFAEGWGCFCTAFWLSLLICLECQFLYFIVGLCTILGTCAAIFDVINNWGESPYWDLIFKGIVAVVAFCTTYAMIALACCGGSGSGREAGSGDDSEETETDTSSYYSDTDVDTDTTQSITFVE